MVVRVRHVTASADLTVGRTVDWGFAATVGSAIRSAKPPKVRPVAEKAVTQPADHVVDRVAHRLEVFEVFEQAPSAVPVAAVSTTNGM